jgi:hypothetical protein
MSTSYESPATRVRMVFGFALVLCIFAMLLGSTVALADFGLVPGSVRAEALNHDGTADTLAGSHPYSFNVHVNLKTDENGRPEDGEARDATVELPPGFFGNPNTVPQCSQLQFEGGTPKCPPDTQIGILHPDISGAGEIVGPLFNLTPPPGDAAEIAFNAFGFRAVLYVTVNSEHGYGLHVVAPDFPLPPTSVNATIWGTPADSSHDAERTERTINGQGPPVPSEGALLPYLTLPTSCEASAPSLTVNADSLQAPGLFVGESGSFVGSGGQPAPISGCEAVPFSPQVSSLPSTSTAGSPSGLRFGVALPDQGLLGPGSISETQPEKVEVTLPEGMTLNPSAANGIVGCSSAQYAAANGEPGHGCPEASKLGTLLAKTPLIDEQIEGSVYLATPHDNPFNSLLALYIVARAPERGVLVKQAGDIHADPVTGRLTTVFDHLPPVSYSSFELNLHEGAHGALTTPQTCGTYTTQTKLYPVSNPNTPVERTSSFTINSAANGGACASSEAQLPNNPNLQAGAASSLAGAFSPFVFKISREDDTQRLGAITASLPEGLLGRLAGVPYCSDAQIATATARSNEGEGAIEQSSPSCPEASQVGVVNITAGAGAQPYAVQGKAYLAGPYKNAPLSLAVITPAIAGPFDLGTVVVRVALYIDQSTAQIRAISDPLPTILDGIPLDIRSVSLSMNRTGFTFNPTSCEPMSVTGEAISTLNQTAGLSNRFQVGGCQGLPFKPAMTITTQGKTSKANGASLTVKLSQKPGEANIHKVDLTLPKVLPARLTTLQQACTEAQFNTNPAGCPQGSFIGTAKAITPVLSVPLTGPAILVSHGGAAFPDVVFLLQANERGSDIRIDLDGKTDIKKGVTYSRFETVPDAPIASFETNLPEGPHSVLAATGNLCTSKLAIPTELSGQNGAKVTQSTKVTVTGCPKTKTLTRAQKLTLALKACHKKPKGPKRASCERTARKKYGPAVKKKGKEKK